MTWGLRARRGRDWGDLGGRTAGSHTLRQKVSRATRHSGEQGSWADSLLAWTAKDIQEETAQPSDKQEKGFNGGMLAFVEKSSGGRHRASKWKAQWLWSKKPRWGISQNYWWRNKSKCAEEADTDLVVMWKWEKSRAGVSWSQIERRSCGEKRLCGGALCTTAWS